MSDDQRRRQLAAVMFADVVGYTALMQANERNAVLLRTKYQAVLGAQVGAFGGRVVQFYGDGALTIFDSSVDALRCAVEIQRQCREEPSVPLRIGVHAGDVIVDEHNVIGDAVNIASRIESFGVAGGILVSDAVHEQVRNQPGLEFIGLGKFRLKNVGRPYDIFGVSGDGLAIPDASLVQGKGARFASLPSNLPNISAPLFGRDQDLAAVLELLDRGRAVTITGPGGMGKTRLAIEIGSRSAASFLDGVSFVDLSAVSQAQGFLPALSQALDVKEAEDRSPADGVVALIGDKQALLVLDNFEQLIEAAPDLANLLEQCPKLHVVVTSQAPLRIVLEQQYPLKPLGLPPPADITDAASVQTYPSLALFVSRARSVKPDFVLTDDNAPAVAAICRRLDGSPLAIGLAAARVGMLSPAAILDRLDHALTLLTRGARDVADRQRTLRATIDWSHSLLNESQQRLFRRLSVFGGSTDVGAIEAVCGSDAGWFDDLGLLIDMGLLHPSGADRLAMLETVREYAAERLEASGEGEAVRRAHADHFASEAAAIGAGIEGTDQLESVARGAQHDADIRAALDYLLAHAAAGDAGAAELGLRMCGDLWMFWHIRARHLSARSYCRAFLAFPTAGGGPSLGHAEALRSLEIALWTLGRFQEALDAGLESHRVAQELEAPRAMALAALILGIGHLGIDSDRAREWSDRAIGLCRSNGLTWATAFAMSLDGIIKAVSGDAAQAESRFAEALVAQRSLGDMEGAGLSLSGLALLAMGRAEADGSIELYRQSRAAFEAIGDRAEEARVLSEMAWPYLAAGDPASARQSLLTSIEAYRDIGSLRGIGTALVGLAAIRAVEGRASEAVTIATAADLLAREEGIVNVYSEDAPGHDHVERARAALSSKEVADATARGARLSLSELLAMSQEGA